jgi:putative nucleotidyltransferase with HDIG domain
MTSAGQLLLYHDLIAGIVTAMEARDPYTASHSLRVANMSELLCRLLDLSESERTSVHIAAHLHDIGKIGISDAVLRKKGPLNGAEWRQMKKHPVVGFDILTKIDCFSEIAKIVRHHHERWDGKGYPDGAAGPAIPFGSRVIAVSDSIDAMMSNRSYRCGMSSERCRREIEKNEGMMYDPKIAEAARKNWDLLLQSRNGFLFGNPFSA